MTQTGDLYNSVAPLRNVTALVTLIHRVTERAHGLPGMATFYGYSGYGKTMAAVYAASRFSALQVQVKESWTGRKLCQATLGEMSVTPARTIADMVDQIAQDLMIADRVLIVDDAHYLVRRGIIGILRDIHESSGAPIILIGEETLPQDLQRWENIHGRMLDWVPALPACMADLDHLAGLYCPAEAMEEAIKPITKAFYGAYNTLLTGGEPEYLESEFRAPQAKGAAAVYKALEVRFPGGSRVTALPANPDTARGFSANVVLDEFAFHVNSRAIWSALFPVISKGDQKLRVISTPNGEGNKFYDLMTGEDGIWSRHHVDIHQAVAQGCPRDIEALRAGMADADAWAQEYELRWLDAASAWLDYDLLSSCEDPRAGQPCAYRGGMCFVGVDIAARNDLFVIWVLELVDGQLVTREIIAEKRITFARQDALLDDVFRRYRVVRVRMDQTGMGEKPVEDARRQHGADRVEGVIFSPAAKLDMATSLKEAFQDRRILVPAGDPGLRADLHSIKSVAGPTGHRRLVSDGETDGHADRFWAGALAVSSAETEYQPYAYRPVPAGGGRDMCRPVRRTAGFRAQQGVW